MRGLNNKRLSIALGCVCVALLVHSGLLFWHHAELKLQVAFASEQTEIFEAMRVQALQNGTADAADCLSYLVDYYPSGTKQQKGSALDIIVEREREIAMREIIVYLHAKTGEDFGENPVPWIRKYANNH